jgi:hypothetical protein
VRHPAVILAILSLALEPTSARALDPSQTDFLQGTLSKPSIFNGQPNLWDQSELARFTVGVGSVDKIHCTGTLIAKNVVLTAGHCVLQPGAHIFGRPWSEKNLKVHFLRYERAGDPAISHEIRSLSRIAIHPIWKSFGTGARGSDPPPPLLHLRPGRMAEIYERNSGFLAYDLAILVLERNAPEGFAIASLPRGKSAPVFRPQCRYFISGFGTDTQMTAEETGDIRMSRFGSVDHRNLANGPYGVRLRGRVNVCHGDSGGPLLEICPERVSVLAVASHLDPVAGDSSCEERNPVSVHPYLWSSLEWLLEQLTKVRYELGA